MRDAPGGTKLRLYDAIIPRASRRVVDPPGAERGAPKDPPQRQGRPAERAHLPHGLLRVLRAAGVEAALPAEDPSQREAIDPDDQQLGEPDRRPGRPERRSNPFGHRRTQAVTKTRSRSADTSASLAPRISGRATIITSYPSRTRLAQARHASFISRRARFRTTAPPMARGQANPTRVVDPSG